jgi:hypothetical protein
MDALAPKRRQLLTGCHPVGVWTGGCAPYVPEGDPTSTDSQHNPSSEAWLCARGHRPPEAGSQVQILTTGQQAERVTFLDEAFVSTVIIE